MRTTRVRVRRDRPSAPAWALALLVTMLMVYLLTLDRSNARSARQADADGAGERVTREVIFEPLALYCLDFGSQDDPAAARVEAARYVPRGAAGFLCERDGRWHILGAGYTQRAEAEQVAARLNGEGEITCAILEFTSGRLRLRVTARAGQIDAVAQADKTLRAQAELLSGLAFQLDRGELQADAARTLLSVQAAEARELLATFRAIPGEDAVFIGLTARVDALISALDTLARENAVSALALSGKIKCEMLAAGIGYIDFLNSLKP